MAALCRCTIENLEELKKGNPRCCAMLGATLVPQLSKRNTKPNIQNFNRFSWA